MVRSATRRKPATERAARELADALDVAPDRSDVEGCAEVAGLRYVNDTTPGIRRRKRGKGFMYLQPGGGTVTDERTLARIRGLAIPPAWTDVWICPQPNGHLQATGRDARGRKQYRYHPLWRQVRDQAKYSKMTEFGAALPKIRRRVQRDLARRGLGRDKVLATVVHLLDTTGLRVGNEEYARDNDSYGLTTLRDSHALITQGRIRFRFRGKSGRKASVEVADRRLARIVKACRDIPGQELFQYIDDEGEAHVVGSGDVNDYLRSVTGTDFTAKDFRTWAGTVAAARTLRELGDPPSAKEARSTIVRAVEAVAEQLGNTPAVARKCYIHPEVLSCYEDGRLSATCQVSSKARGLDPDEAFVLALLRRASKPPSKRAA